MRNGFLLSVLFHLAFFAFVIFLASRPEQLPDLAGRQTPVELVTVDELTNLQKAAREETPTLRQGPRTPAPTPEAKPEPEPAPVKEAAAPEPEPVPVPETPERLPEPEPTPEPEPAPVAKAEPEPAPEPAPTPERLPANIPTPVPRPVRVAESDPEPEPEAKKKPEAKAKPEPKKAEAKPQPKKDKFDPNQIASLLDKIPDQKPKPQAQASPTAPSGGAPKLTMSEKDALKRQVERCWSPPVGAPNAADLRVQVRIQLRPDGTLAGNPQLINRGGLASGDPYFRAAAESAIRAIRQCAPYKMPPQKYASWKDVDLNFDPRDMLGG